MENRKVLVNRLQELTGRRAVYTRMPECAFVIDDYKVEKNGTLIVAEDAEMALIETLLAEGLIVPYEPDMAEAEEAATEPNEEPAEEEENGGVTMDETGPEEPSEEGENEALPEEPQPMEGQEEAQMEPMEGQDGLQPQPEEEAQPQSTEGETEPQPMEGEVVQLQPAEGQEETQPSEESEAEPAEPDHYAVTLPMKNHSVTSLRNLVNMVYARAGLISKATGGTFSCTEDLIKDLEGVVTIENLIAITNDHEGELKGLEISKEQIAFTGFPKTEDADKIQAFTQLVTLMNKMAITSKRVLARPVVEDNERYIFRIWLLRLGMAGKEYATARKILLEPLAGNAAFKDKAMEDRWKAKRKAASEEDPATEEDAEDTGTADTEDTGGGATGEEPNTGEGNTAEEGNTGDGGEPADNATEPDLGTDGPGSGIDGSAPDTDEPADNTDEDTPTPPQEFTSLVDSLLQDTEE